MRSARRSPASRPASTACVPRLRWLHGWLAIYHATVTDRHRPSPSLPLLQQQVFHGTDLVFVFELNTALDLGANFSSNADDIYTETELSKMFGSYWSSFAAHKSPGSTWPQFNDGGSTDETFMYLDTTAVTADGDGLKDGVCDFWDENPPPVSAIFGPAVFSTSA